MKNLLLGFIALVLAACGQNDESKPAEPQFIAKGPQTGKEYLFAIYPLHNPVHLFELYGPIIDYLNRNIPEAKFRLETSHDYEDFDNKLYGREFDFALANSFQTFNSLKHGYHVIAKKGDDHLCTGILLVRRDSGIKKVTDLKGKKISYPARTAVAGTLMPQYFLQRQGVDVNRDIENVYVGSQDASIMSVFLGDTSAAATWRQPWEVFQKEFPDRAKQLELKWESEPLLNNGVVVRDDVPKTLAQRVAQLLDTLHTNDEGRAILAELSLSRFELADDDRYREIGDFVSKFSREVRPLDTPER